MSKKKRIPAAIEEPQEPRMYVGPSFQGILPKGTAFNEGIPNRVNQLIEKCPAIKELIIPVSQVGVALNEIQSKKGSIYTFYCKVETFLIS